jgi:hypothetical protein
LLRKKKGRCRSLVRGLPEAGDGVRDTFLEDFDEFSVFVGDFMLGFDLSDDLP